MRAFVALALLLVAAPAAADSKPAAKRAKTEAVMPAKAKAAKPGEAAKPVCKRVVQGRGLERKVIWQCEAPVVVHASHDKPKVVYVTRDGRNVTGRPKSGDRLEGLGPHTK